MLARVPRIRHSQFFALFFKNLFAKSKKYDIIFVISTERGDTVGKRKERVKELFHDKELGEVKHYSKGYAATVLSVVSAVSCILAILGFIILKREFSDTNVLREWIADNPILGSIFMIFIVAVQVVIALIPGEVVEIARDFLKSI